MDKTPRLTTAGRHQMDELQKAYLEAVMDTLCDSSCSAREKITFDSFYDLSGMKKAQIIRLLQNDADFHIGLRTQVETHNAKAKQPESAPAIIENTRIHDIE